jgi:hypothetical protein
VTIAIPDGNGAGAATPVDASPNARDRRPTWGEVTDHSGE